MLGVVQFYQKVNIALAVGITTGVGAKYICLFYRFTCKIGFNGLYILCAQLHIQKYNLVT